MKCRAKDIEKRLGIALRKLENCIEYLTLALSRDGVNNPFMSAREHCYSRYGKTLSYLTMLNELMKILGVEEQGSEIMCYFSLNSLEVKIDGAYFRIKEPLPISNRILVEIENLSKEGLEIIDMITEAAVRSREPLIRSGVLYIYFLLDFEDVEGGAMALIRSYGFLDTKYYRNFLESLGHSGTDYTVYDLVRIVDLKTGTMISTDAAKKMTST